ncbi:hypothetical protein RDWZM_001509 [Blomia tropicalis]|uniref:Brix domain-containing protein n=1 Tax=Blomia tropicalis TaxID=40697 RepID=A0A9Q0MCJ7_BLOTA|nr:hypothetical protein RDWZM_001509 [Blomia tropicalis]
MGKRKRKNKGTKEEPEDLVKAPHSFVIRKGNVGKHVEQLMQDFRIVMEPFTASNLKLRKKNVIKDFVSISSYLNVTHLAIFTRTDKSPYFRLIRMPRGPTITFKIAEYSLTHDVISSLRKPHVNSTLFHTSPLLVMNGFTNNEDLKFKLMTSMLRNMFPTIDIHKIKLGTIKRCVLFNYDHESGHIEFRHYAIKVKPVGLSNTVRKLMTGKKIPDLGQFSNVEEAIEQSQMATFTESEGEGDEHDETRHVTLPQKLNIRGSLKNEKSSIRLVELGPRMSLELVKIEDGVMTGEVLYHSYITKTNEEIQETKQKMDIKKTKKQ